MRSSVTLLTLLVALLLATPALADVAPRPDRQPITPTLKNMILLDDGALVLGGVPTPEELADFAQVGFTTIIDLRTSKEPGWEAERDAAKVLGMSWLSLPVSGTDGITFENAAAMLELLEGAKGSTILHCGSGNRVGALFALAVGAIPGTSVDEAIAYGKARGLTRLEPKVRELLEAR